MSFRILDVVEKVVESFPIPVNETKVVIPLSSFAVSVQEVDEENYVGGSFSVLFGDSFDFKEGGGPINITSLVFEENPEATASIMLPDDLFSEISNDVNSSIRAPKRRISNSVYLTDSLFARRKESNLTVGSIIISASISGGITIENLMTPIMLSFIKSPVSCQILLQLDISKTLTVLVLFTQQSNLPLQAVENGSNPLCTFWDVAADGMSL